MAGRRTGGASTRVAKFPLSVHRGSVRRTIVEAFDLTASEAVGELTPGCEIFGLTKGQFSLIDLLCALLEQTGPADVAIATWTAAHAEMRTAYEFLGRGDIRTLRWVVDHSFAARRPEFARALLDTFGAESIRITRTHAKFVLIRNEQWDLAVRTSMNLNRNPRLEDFEVSDCAALAGYLQDVVDEVFSRQEVGQVLDRRNTSSVREEFKALYTGKRQLPVIGWSGVVDCPSPSDGFDLGVEDIAPFELIG